MTKPPSECHPDKPAVTRGLCGACYVRMRRRGIQHPELAMLPAIEAEGPPINPDTPCCDVCADDDVPLARLCLTASMFINGKRTSRGAGVIDICERCWAKMRAKARTNSRWARRRRKPVAAAA